MPRLRIVGNTKQLRARKKSRNASAGATQDNVDWKDEYWRLVAVESELEDSRRRYAALYDTAPVGYATLDRYGCIRDLNLTGANILGRQRENVIGGTLLALVTKTDQRKFLGHLSLVQASTQSVTAEMHFERPDNSILLLQLVSESTDTKNEGPDTIRTVFSDVTGQRRVELELNESRAELAAITTSAMDAIISLTADQRIVHFNAAAESMFCCRNEQANGRSFLEFIPEIYRAKFRQLFRYYIQPGATIGGMETLTELWGLRINGQEFPIEASVSQTEVRGQKRLIVVMRDVTRRKQAENEILHLNDVLESRVQTRTAELERVNQDLRREVAERRHLQEQLLEISEREQRRIGQDLHDGIGQQLTGVMLLNDTLLHKLARIAPAEAADGRRIALLLADARVQIRQLSRGLQPVEQSPQGLMTALGQLAQTVSNLHGVKCRFDCIESVSLENDLVATHLFRIAQEAVHNAVRHGHCRRITISLSTHDASLRLKVRDNGRGLSSTAVGPGLGLQIMKSRCEAIGGKLSISAVRPHGTEIACEAPLSATHCGSKKLC